MPYSVASGGQMGFFGVGSKAPPAKKDIVPVKTGTRQRYSFAKCVSQLAEYRNHS